MAAVIEIRTQHLYDPSPLRAEIARRGITQREIARALGCHEVTLSKVLRGIPESTRVILGLCSLLDIPRGAVLTPLASDEKALSA